MNCDYNIKYSWLFLGFSCPNLPVPQISTDHQKPFEILVDFVLSAREKGLESEASTLESVIDGLVYDLYFEEDMKKANCYITDRIREVVKPIKDDVTDPSPPE